MISFRPIFSTQGTERKKKRRVRKSRNQREREKTLINILFFAHELTCLILSYFLWFTLYFAAYKGKQSRHASGAVRVVIELLERPSNVRVEPPSRSLGIVGKVRCVHVCMHVCVC